MEPGAIVQDISSLHIAVGRASNKAAISVSTQIAALRRLLYGWESTDTETGFWFKRAAEVCSYLVVLLQEVDIQIFRELSRW
jgi:hypothetical protein